MFDDSLHLLGRILLCCKRIKSQFNSQFIRREEKKGIKDGSNKLWQAEGSLAFYVSLIDTLVSHFRFDVCLRVFVRNHSHQSVFGLQVHFHANETLPQTAMCYNAQSTERRFLNGWRSLWPKSGMVSHVLVPINAMNSCVIQITVMTRTFRH